MKVKTGFSLVVMLAALAFGPKENRDFLFRTPADRLYGEVEVFRDDKCVLSLARNASTNNVELLGSCTIRARSVDPKEKTFYTNEVEKLVYAGSLAVVERVILSGPTLEKIRIGSTQPRTPRGLHIVTEAEAFYEFMWPGVIVLLAVILAYLINDYSWECGSPIKDIIESEE